MFTKNEKAILRDLAKQVKAISELPVMRKRKKEWFRHNQLEDGTPLILVFPEGAWRELVLPGELLCESPNAREIEWKLRARIYKHEKINDDSVITDKCDVHKIITNTGWGFSDKAHMPVANQFVVDSILGYVPTLWEKNYSFNEKAVGFTPVIEKPKDLQKMRSPEIIYNEKQSVQNFEEAQDILGDILSVSLVGKKYIDFPLIAQYASFRGLEQVYYDLYDEPEMVHEALSRLETGYRSMIDQYADMGLLELNNDDAYCGSGGLGYTDELPGENFADNKVMPINVWACAQSQEFANVSPEMHNIFAIQYEKRLLSSFGLSAYGCCDPLDKKLDYVLEIPNIRRISISPWANVEECAEKIKKRAIFSWKPNPSYISNHFDVSFLSGYIEDALLKTRNNNIEIVLKDTHTCNNQPSNFHVWTELVRSKIAEAR